MIASAEKRQCKRQLTYFTVEYRSKNIWQLAQARNISMHGILIVADKIDPAKTKVELFFELGKEAEEENICVEGIIAWNRPDLFIGQERGTLSHGMGIRFTKLMPSLSRGLIHEMAKGESLK